MEQHVGKRIQTVPDPVSPPLHHLTSFTSTFNSIFTPNWLTSLLGDHGTGQRSPGEASRCQLFIGEPAAGGEATEAAARAGAAIPVVEMAAISLRLRVEFGQELVTGKMGMQALDKCW